MRSCTKQFGFGLLSLLLSADMLADELGKDAVFDAVAVYAAQGVNHNLRELPSRIVTGSVEWEQSYFAALALSKSGKPLEQSWEGFSGTPFASLRQGYETVLVQHGGMQDNAELGMAYTLRTADLQLGQLGVNFSAGSGLSHAFGTPTYEDGPKNDPGKRYRTQLLLLFEFEWRLADYRNLSFVTRAHHRSGVYGLIAPRNVGSNFLAMGLRYSF